MQGLIDDVRIYDRALTDAEVLGLYDMVGAEPVGLELVEQNITNALEIKEGILEDLQTALDMEVIAQETLRQMQKSGQREGLTRIDIIRARIAVVRAIIDENQSKQKLEDSIDKLEVAMDSLEGNSIPEVRVRRSVKK